jgi:hypothetical protein
MVIEYWSNRWDLSESPSFNPRLASAVGQAQPDWDAMLIRQGAFALARVDEPRVAEVLLDRYDSFPPGQARDALVAAMGDLSHPRAQELFAAFCAQDEQRDVACREDFDLGDLPEAFEPSSDCLGLPDLRSRLGQGDWQASGELMVCLRTLATSDRASASAQAEAMQSWEIADPSVAVLVRTLARFADARALGAHLAGIGLMDEDELASEIEESLLTAADMLTAAGRVTAFDVETDQYPNNHDGLLLELAMTAGPPLAAAVFEEQAPPLQLDNDTFVLGGQQVRKLPPGRHVGEPYRLRGWLEGRLFEVEAQDFGDWYDLDQVLGMLNAMAIELGADTRLVALATGDQTAMVLTGRRQAIEKAIEEGLLNVGQASAAMDEGKAFELEAMARMDQEREEGE